MLGTEKKRSSFGHSYENQDSKTSKQNSDVLTAQSPGESCRSKGTFRRKEKKGSSRQSCSGKNRRNS